MDDTTPAALAEELTTREQLKDALACWARGMDLTIEGRLDEGQAEWDRCYASPDYQFRVFFRGQTIEGLSTADRRTTNGETAGFFGYTAAQHYVSNFDIAIDGNTATVSALQTADHFLPNLTVETTWGILTVQFARDAETGAWRAVDETMDITHFVAFPGVEAPSSAPMLPTE